MLALVTGGNRGLGFAACEELAKRGIKVLLGSRNKSDGKQAIQELKKKSYDVDLIHIDVNEKTSIQIASEEIHANYGSLDILINNAAIYPEGGLLTISEEQIREGISTNLMGPLQCIRAFSNGMIQKKYGRIVNVSSGCGSFKKGLNCAPVYSLSKVALNAVTVLAAREFPEYVKINSASPGWVKTRMGGSNAPRSIEEGIDTIIWLATLPSDGPSGGFFQDRKPMDW